MSVGSFATEEPQRAVTENGASGRVDKRGHSGAGVTAALCWHSRLSGVRCRALVSAVAVETWADAIPTNAAGVSQTAATKNPEDGARTGSRRGGRVDAAGSMA